MNGKSNMHDKLTQAQAAKILGVSRLGLFLRGLSDGGGGVHTGKCAHGDDGVGPGTICLRPVLSLCGHVGG